MTILGAITGALPHIATLLAVIWYMINIMESKQVKVWIRLRKHRRWLRMQARKQALEKK